MTSLLSLNDLMEPRRLRLWSWCVLTWRRSCEPAFCRLVCLEPDALASRDRHGLFVETGFAGSERVNVRRGRSKAPHRALASLLTFGGRGARFRRGAPAGLSEQRVFLSSDSSP